MADFAFNHRRDAYKNFKFLIQAEGQTLSGIRKVSPLVRRTEVIRQRDGAEPSNVRFSPGVTTYEPITIERGVTHDDTFERWANKVWILNNALGLESSLADFRFDMAIRILNEAGQTVIAYNVFRCWVSEYTAVSELDALGRETLVQRIVIQHEGWERDEAVTEPQEPSF